MKLVASIILAIILIFVGTRVYSFWGEEKQLNQNLADVETRLAAAKTNETDLQSDVQYLANPLNLEKELRSRFNYKKPGETMIVIVPEGSSTATSSEE
jgi:cell division protein FtsB